MKKKVLFIMPSMFIGGAERSLLGLLEAMDYDRVDASLFLYRHEGEFLKYVPAQVHILPEMDRYRTFDVPIASLLGTKKTAFGLARILSKAAQKFHCMKTGEESGIWMSMQYTARFLTPLLPVIPGEYDLAVMFLGVADILVHKVHARKKITWCHTDYDTLGPNRKMDLEIYRQVDGVIGVSEDCSEKIRKTYPEIADRVMTIENVLAPRLAIQQAEEFVPEWNSGNSIRVLSIGRYSYAKNFDNVPHICKILVDQYGLDLRWYLVGYGGDEQKIRDAIQSAGMESHVIMLGKKQNPYPYLKTCDLYVQPSRYEGKCVAVREAQMLGKPVVITDYATSASQLENGIDGIVVPMDNGGCAFGIAELLKHPERMQELSQACLKRDYSNAEEIRKLYQLMEG